ncbi:MAG: metallophosphoesterase [Phycisphaerae bacterium]|nr:metallophosphoesterase [Phycisphaerae bacterium]
MKRIVAVLVLFFSLIGICGAAGNIIYPWNAITSIVKSGESFEIWFNAEPDQVVDSITLRGPYNTIKIPSSSIKFVTGKWKYDPVSGNTYNRRFTVTVPKTIPEDRYDLILNTNQGQVNSVSSVKVIRQYQKNYKIFHIADSHLGQRTNPEGLIEAKHTAYVNIANIINPEIVINAGDVVYYNSNPSDLQKRMNLFYLGDDSKGWKGIHDFNAATFVVRGNHDFQQGGTDGLPQGGYHDQKANYWNQYHGLQYHSFKYGNSRFMLFNNSYYGNYDWSWQRDLASDWLDSEGSGGTFKVAVAHISQPNEMNPFASKNDLGLYLLGHNHHLGDRNPYKLDDRLIMYYARAVRDHFEFSLYLVDDSAATYTALGYKNIFPETDGNGLSTASNRVLENDSEKNNPDSSVWIYNLTLDYAHDNDGSVPTNTATLINKFDFVIPDARVRFVMPKGNNYAVSQGTITQTFDGDKFHIIDMNIDLSADSTTVVEIAPVNFLQNQH